MRAIPGIRDSGNNIQIRGAQTRQKGDSQETKGLQGFVRGLRWFPSHEELWK